MYHNTIAHNKETIQSYHICFYYAGIQFVSPVESFPDEKWNDIIAINLNSVFHTIKHALPGMKQRGWGMVAS
jgi:3-hydroxybutyrate dehydrogenase